MTEEERIESVRRDGEHLKLIKEENRTYEVCLAAVRNNGNVLFYVPKQHRSYDVYFNACSNAGVMLRLVPLEQRDMKLCTAAVSSNGMALEYVPEELRTEELCMLAICNSAESLRFVPKQLVTPEYCAKIIRTSRNTTLISYIPVELKKACFYEKLIQIIPDVFFYIPRKFRTAKICKLAIKGLGYNSVADAVKCSADIFDLLHVSLLNYDTCLAYVESHPELADKYLTPRTKQPLEKVLIAEDICKIALRYNGRLLQYVPQNVITEELCKIAVSNDYYAIKYVPENLISEEVCNIAFQQDVSAICHIPEKYLDYSKCLAAVTKYGIFLDYVPELLRTKEICNAALKADMDALLSVPQKYISREILLNALNVGRPSIYSLVSYIPNDLWDEEIFQIVFERFGIYSSAISTVPENKLTYEMCLANVRYSAYAVLEVPERYRTAEIYIEAARSIGKQGYPRDWKIVERIPEIWKTNDFYAEIKKNASIECIRHLPSNCSDYDSPCKND